MLGVTFAARLGVHMDSATGQRVARGTAYVCPFAIALAYRNQPQQRACVASLWLLGRQFYVVLFKIHFFVSFKWEFSKLVVIGSHVAQS